MNKPYELFSRNTPPPSLRFSPPLAPSSFSQTLIITSICPKTTQLFDASHTHAPAPTVLAYQCSIARGCAAPILITLGEHTCENRCPPGLACCSSLGWSVCVWLSATPPLPSLSSVQSFSGSQQADLASTLRQEEPTATSGGGQEASAPRLSPLLCLF